MEWLDPGLIFASPSVAFGFAVHAWRRAADGWAVYLAAGLTGLELMAWVVLWLMPLVG